MTKPTGKPRGRPKGSTKAQGSQRLTRQRLAELMDGSTATTFAERQFCKTYGRLPAKDAIRMRLSLEARPRAVPAAEPASVTMRVFLSGCKTCECASCVRVRERFPAATNEETSRGAEGEPREEPLELTDEQRAEIAFQEEQAALQRELDEQNAESLRNAPPDWMKPL